MKNLSKNSLKVSLKELGFSQNERKIYLALTELGEARASIIAKKVNLPRTTTIGVLERLKNFNYLSSHIYKKKTIYWIESPKRLREFFLNRADIAEKIVPFLDDLYRTEPDFPETKIFDTKRTCKLLIEKTLIKLPKNTIIYSIDKPSAGNYAKIMSEDFTKVMINLKQKKGIITKTLIPFDAFKTINQQKIKNQQIFLREMPKEIDFRASLWIIEDKVFLFSGRFPFIVETRHKIITQSLKSIFDFLWNISRPKN